MQNTYTYSRRSDMVGRAMNVESDELDEPHDKLQSRPDSDLHDDVVRHCNVAEGHTNPKISSCTSGNSLSGFATVKMN